MPSRTAAQDSSVAPSMPCRLVVENEHAARPPGPRPPSRRGRGGAPCRPRSAPCSRAGSPTVAASGSSSRMRSRVAGVSAGSGMPIRSHSSAASAESPPEQVSTASRRARPARARHGERLGELEQLVEVRRPRAARLLDERAEDALIAGQRAGVRGGSRRPGGRAAHLQHRDADAAPRRSGQAPRTCARRRHPPRGRARSSRRPGRPRARRPRPPDRAPPSCRTRRPCADAGRGSRSAR